MPILCSSRPGRSSGALLPPFLKFGLQFASTVIVVLLAAVCASAADRSVSAKPPIRALFLTGGGWHDYEKLTPHLTNNLGNLVNVTFDVTTGLDRLKDPKFADAYDVLVYNLCFDEAPDEVLDNAIQATRKGKPTVMIHCSVHAFRRSPKIHEWETCCGMRSKVHDTFGPFAVNKLDPASPITKSFPEDWKTNGDELYQTISIDPKSHPLLKAKSPQDGREHIVCWIYQFGQGPVFATTLGHDMKTSATPEYLRLLANGLLWACDKLDPSGKPAAGYSGPEIKP
ncbi:MAG: ThuA domain-containing protein [Pedosphaera sp.]|nr:ThuA domain-containing protein [Pedosphaera sp.]